MSTRLFAGLLVGAVMAPHPGVSADANRDALRPPPIPYVETIPWLAGTAEPKTNPYLGLLLAPTPFTAMPVFAAAPVADHSLFAGQLTKSSTVE